MIREIIRPTSEYYNLHIPKEYINQEVEILVLPFSYKKKQKETEYKDNDIFSKTSGILKTKNIDPLEWQKEMRSDREI